MAFVHVASQGLAPRALGAHRLLEQATTEAERESCARFCKMLERQGITAAALEIEVPEVQASRVSEDGLLFVRNEVWWKGLLLGGLAGSMGFYQEGKVLERTDDGRWRIWFAGPPRALLELRLWYATLSFLVAVASLRLDMSIFARDQVWLSMALGAAGEVAQEARWRAPKTAIVRWGGRELPQDPPAPSDPARAKEIGEGLRKMQAFQGFGAMLMAQYVEAGRATSRRAARLWKEPEQSRPAEPFRDTAPVFMRGGQLVRFVRLPSR